MSLLQSIVTARNAAMNGQYSTLTNPDEWLIDLVGGKKTEAGVTVSERSSLRYPALWKGVNLISKDVAKLPFMIHEKTEGNSRERDETHPAYNLVRNRVNPNVTWKTFVRTVTAHAVLRGNGFAYIDRNALEEPISLLPIHPDCVSVRRDEDGSLHYVVQVGGGLRRVETQNMLHIRGLSNEAMTGYDVVSLMAESIGLGDAARQFGAKFFGNGANVSGLLMVPSRLQPKAQTNLLKSWNKIATGLSKAHKVALLKEGAKFEKLTVTPEQAQFLGTRSFENKEIALILGVPPSKLGDPDRTSYNSLEQENQSYLSEGLDHWLVEWEDACRDKLLSDEERLNETHYFEFNRDAIIQTDTTTKTNNLISLGNNGYMTDNEIRDKLNMPRFDDGDRRRMPVNIAYVGSDNESEPEEEIQDDQEIDEKEAEPKPPQPDNRLLLDKLSILLVDRTKRMIRIEQSKIVNAAQNVDNFMEWMDRFYSAQEKKFDESLSLVIAALDAYFGVPLNVDVGHRHCASSRSMLLEKLDTCKQSELPEVMNDLVSTWEQRAETFSSFIKDTYYAKLQS